MIDSSENGIKIVTKAIDPLTDVLFDQKSSTFKICIATVSYFLHAISILYNNSENTVNEGTKIFRPSCGDRRVAFNWNDIEQTEIRSSREV